MNAALEREREREREISSHAHTVTIPHILALVIVEF